MENQLQTIVQQSGLEKNKAEFILQQFQDYFKIAAEWEEKAKTIVVTDESQTTDMEMARVGRLFLRDKRLTIEKATKSLKEQCIRERKAIDGIANVLKALIVPTEEYLKEQEKFVELKEKREEEAKKIEEENKLLREQIRLLQQAARAASEPGVKSFTPPQEGTSGGMKYGGPVLPMQSGGTIPGFGGGDKHIRALEGGEEVLDKYTAQFARRHGILAALREAAHGGGGARDYLTLDLQFGRGSYPLTVEKDDVVERLVEDVRRHRMTHG